MGKRLQITREITEEELKDAYTREKDATIKQRLLMLLHVNSGKSARQTAELLFVDKNTVSLWVKRFNEFGFEGLSDKKREGRPRKIDYDDLRVALRKKPTEFGYPQQSWHPKLVVTYLMDHQNVKLGKNYVYSLLRRMGYRLIVPSKRSYKSDPKKVLEFKKKMTEIIETNPLTHIGSLDECSIQLVTLPKKVIAMEGTKPEILTQKKWGGITVIGTIVGDGRVIVQIQDHATNEKCFKKYLKYLKKQFTRGRLHITLDNASFHHRLKVKRLAERLSISLHFQPTHSPFVNGAEEIWRQLREYLRGMLIKSKDHLKTEISKFFFEHPILNIKVVRYLC